MKRFDPTPRHRLMSGLWRALAAVLVGLMLVSMAPLPVLAQDPPAAETVDYQKWEAAAEKAEKELADPALADDRLDALRQDLVQWRNALTTAQTANAARIGTVREQIAALGAAPAEGQSEAQEIAARRQELTDQLVKLQAPGLAAEEAYRRADGLIREIDRELRERQADQLLQLWPSPLNPANWPEAVTGMSDTAYRLWNEGLSGWSDGRARNQFFSNLPLILVLVLIAAGTTIFARRWIESLADRLQARGSEARQRVVALLASLGQVIVPTIGMVALSSALILTGILGDLTGALARALPALGLMLFLAIWLGWRAFPRQQEEDAILHLPQERRAEGRFHAAMLGFVLVAEAAREILMGPQGYSDAVTAVASFPIICAGGLILWRVGRILRLSREEGTQNYALTILSILARVCGIIGVIGPILAAFGYVAAAKAMLFPAIFSLGLLVLLLVVQDLLSDLWALVSRTSVVENRKGLAPVLTGITLMLLALPVFALIWGARLSDLTELWTRFREGFQMGETRISPTAVLIFALIFALGYMITRLLQGALRNTVLPRTKIEQGGQNALVSGTGYVGIFFAALLAINATGIDLSGLAIVASALSVGIGFGLQNIVQNFVSGIILMIERPVSEGDWIAVGTTQGTVKSISVRSTRIQTFDRNVVVVPNADLVSQPVTNWTRFSLSGRVIVPVGVAFGSDTRKVEKILRDIAEAQPLAILNPPPLVLFQGFGADAMNFEIRLVLRDVNFSATVKSEINHQIVQRFEEEGIEIPFAQSEITLRNTEELAIAVARLMKLREDVTEDPLPPPPTDEDAGDGESDIPRRPAPPRSPMDLP